MVTRSGRFRCSHCRAPWRRSCSRSRKSISSGSATWASPSTCWRSSSAWPAARSMRSFWSSRSRSVLRRPGCCAAPPSARKKRRRASPVSPEWPGEMAEVASSAEDRAAVLRDPENLRAETVATLAPASVYSKAELDPSQPIIALEGVCYTYEGESEPVLRDLSLTVRSGEFVLILGPSGCGKSTLLNLLNGSAPHLLHGTLTGGARVCGKSVAETKVVEFATEVGMVFQDPDAQIINSRVRDEVCFGLENLCRPTPEILTRQAEALGFVGLSGFGDRSIFELSGGQKQRVSIAAVLAAQPRLLVLDEPTANLDPAGMAEVFAVLARLNEEHGTTIVM